MVAPEVKYVKENLKPLIKKATTNNYGVIFGHQKHILADVCFARLYSRITEQKSNGKAKSNMQYLLRYEVGPGKRTFAYKKLIAELNELFGTYFKISMHLSGRKAAKIINIKEKKKFPHITMKYAAYLLLMVLLRAIDGEFFARWRANAQKFNLPINNWFDIIFHYYATIGIWGHGINDTVGNLGQQYHTNKTVGSKKLFEASIKHYLDTLQKAFGSDFDYSDVKFPKISVHDYKMKGQTAIFQMMEKIVTNGVGK